MPRKPWEIPIEYNDPRWDEASPAESSSGQLSHNETDEGDEREERDIEALLKRETRNPSGYECNDTTPLNYSKGPHQDEFGVDEKDFEAPDDDPVPYGNGEHEDEFGFDDEE